MEWGVGLQSQDKIQLHGLCLGLWLKCVPKPYRVIRHGQETLLRDIEPSGYDPGAHARASGIKQDSASRLEKRNDLLLSTLRKTVETMVGSLSVVAEFPGRPSVVLSGIAGDQPPDKPTGRKHAHAHA